MNALPVEPDAVGALVIAGATLKITFVAAPVPAPLAALMLAVYGLPAALVGVPAMAPVPGVTFRPGGKNRGTKTVADLVAENRE